MAESESNDPRGKVFSFALLTFTGNFFDPFSFPESDELQLSSTSKNKMKGKKYILIVISVF